MAKVTIDIASEFKGKKAFKDAEKSTNSLDKSVESLAKKLAAAFAVDKIVDFGKASVKAFMEDQKSAALLANTMKNLGLQFATPQVESYIANLSKTAAVADDVLRPAMQKLLQVTGSVTKSQELMQNAIDISRGSGEDLNTVVSDLSAAFVGNTKGLKKYNLGLTQAELKTASFDKIMQQLNKNFTGSNQAYLKTYAGQMEVLNTAAGEAQETIGKGLIDALSLLIGEDGNVQMIADAFANLSQNIADTALGLADLGKSLKKIPGLNSVMKNLQWWAEHGGLGLVGLAVTGKGAAEKGRAIRAGQVISSSQSAHLAELMAPSNAAAAAKAEAAAKKRAKEIANAQNKNTKALKDQSLIKKQSAIFDVQQIGLIAALKGKLSDEDRKRVELQLALLNGNQEEATKLSAEIANSIDKTGSLAKYLTTLPDANNPFKSWQTYLDSIEAQVAKITGMGTGGNTQVAPTTNATGITNMPPEGSYALNYGKTTNSNYGLGGSQTDSAASIVIQIDGKTIAEAVQSQSLNGNQSVINRALGTFAQ
jgi:hypothetical protein